MRKKAFTLIEMVFTIAILLVLLSISIFKFSNIKDLKIQKEVESIKEDIEFSRNIAITNNEKSEIIFKDNYYEIKCKDFYKREKVSKEIEIKFERYDSKKSISFTQTGSPDFISSQTIIIKAKREYKITVLPVTGEVRLY